MEGEHTVQVWNTPQQVSVHRSSKSVWIARGEYMGQYIETKGRSASSAIAHWREAARYKGG